MDGGVTVRVSKGDTFSLSTDIVASDSGIWWTNDDFDQRVAYCPLSLCPGAATKLPDPGAGGPGAEGLSTAIAQADDG